MKLMLKNMKIIVSILILLYITACDSHPGYTKYRQCKTNHVKDRQLCEKVWDRYQNTRDKLSFDFEREYELQKAQ